MSKVVAAVLATSFAISMGLSSLILVEQVVVQDIRSKAKVTPLQHLKMPTVDNVRQRVKEACPGDMSHVIGEYCPELVQTCIKERKRDPHVKNPGKTPVVCEEFTKTSTCLSKKTTHLDFCMDTFEHTEEVSDLPRVYISWWDAKNSCEIEGKRLCNVQEFEKACEGPDNHALGYGDGRTRDSSICNVNKMWHDPLTTPFAKLDKRVSVTSMENCKSDYGIRHINGNVDEFVMNENGSYHHEPWVSTLMGGHAFGVRSMCRAMTTSHSPDFSFYIQGYRCCKDVEKN